MQSNLDIKVFRTDRPGVRKVLGDLETDIMDVIWARPAGEGVTVRDVYEFLVAGRRIAYTTVMNTMARLAKKQLLRVDKIDQTYVYYAMYSRDEFIARFVERILDDLLASFASATLNRLDELTDPAAETRVQRLLDDIARRRAAGES